MREKALDLQVKNEAVAKIGSTVLVRFDTGTTLRVVIKTPREVDPSCGVVSYESPIGAAVLDKRNGESFEYAVEGKKFSGQVLEIC